MITISNFIHEFPLHEYRSKTPWEITPILKSILEGMILKLSSDFKISDGIAIHYSAVVETGTILKRPVIIGPECFIGAHAYLRGGVFLHHNVTIGPSSEIKSSVISKGSSLAHFNFIGDSIIGSNVNFEAGSLIANHHNDKTNKEIFIVQGSEIISTGVTKFGALVGDNCKIGANAVLSPGTVLTSNSIVKRLQLVEQGTNHM